MGISRNIETFFSARMFPLPEFFRRLASLPVCTLPLSECFTTFYGFLNSFIREIKNARVGNTTLTALFRVGSKYAVI